MEIKVQQEKISIAREKYDILVDGHIKYKAATPLLLGHTMKIFEVDSKEPVVILQGIIKALEANIKYEIIRGNDTYYFTTKDMARLHYHCQVGSDDYEIFGHTGRKFSVYKNGTQIAWWKSNKLKIFKGDNYTILCNWDVDVELVASFCLILDFEQSENNGLIGINPEQLVLNEKPFDADWQPH